MLQRNVDRLEAAQDYRLLQIAVSATTSEGLKTHTERLLKIIGKVVVYDEQKQIEAVVAEEKLDVEGLNRLRGMGKLYK